MDQIKLDVKPPAANKPVDCHVLPCKIHHTGQANVSRYFHVDHEQKIVYFRGRNLKGRDVELPEGYSGYTFKEVYHGTRGLQSIEQFDKLTVWGHEQQPDEHDSWVSIPDWISIAHLIHDE